MPIKLMAVSRRRPGLTRAEYFRYIEHYHGTVARLERFKIDRYIQNHVHRRRLRRPLRHQPPQQGRRPRRGRGAALQRVPRHARHPRARGRHRSRAPTRTAASSPTSPPTSSSWPRRPNCRCRTRGPSSTPAWASRVWALSRSCSSSCASPRSSPTTTTSCGGRRTTRLWPSRRTRRSSSARSCVSKRSRVNDNDAAARAHFRMVDPPVYDMVVSFWVDSIEQVGAFRQYVDALQETPARFRRLVGVVLPVRPAGAHHRRRPAERLTARKTEVTNDHARS